MPEALEVLDLHSVEQRRRGGQRDRLVVERREDKSKVSGPEFVDLVEVVIAPGLLRLILLTLVPASLHVADQRTRFLVWQKSDTIRSDCRGARRHSERSGDVFNTAKRVGGK